MMLKIIYLLLIVISVIFLVLWVVKKDSKYESQAALVSGIAALLFYLFSEFTIIEIDKYNTYKEAFELSKKPANSSIIFNSSPLEFDMNDGNRNNQKTITISTEALNGDFAIDSINLIEYEFNEAKDILFKSEYDIKPSIKLISKKEEKNLLSDKNPKADIKIILEPYVLFVPTILMLADTGVEQKQKIGSITFKVYYRDIRTNTRNEYDVITPILISYKK